MVPLYLYTDAMPDSACAITSALIGRTITSTNEVTGDEASRIIDQLVRINDGELQLVPALDGTWSVEAIEAVGGDTAAEEQ